MSTCVLKQLHINHLQTYGERRTNLFINSSIDQGQTSSQTRTQTVSLLHKCKDKLRDYPPCKLSQHVQPYALTQYTKRHSK